MESTPMEQAVLPPHDEEAKQDETTKDAAQEAVSATETKVSKIETETDPVELTSKTGGIAESESKVAEHPPTTLPNPHVRDTNVTAESESPMHGLTPGEGETIYKPEEDGSKTLQHARYDPDAGQTAQCIRESATCGAELQASLATAGITDHKEAPREESAGEIAEALTSKLVQTEVFSCVETNSADIASETANTCDEAEEVADETEVISDPDVTNPIDEAIIGQTTESVKESEGVGHHGPIAVASTGNTQNNETKPCEGQAGVVEVPTSVEGKISEAEAGEEKNDDCSPSDDLSGDTKMTVTPEVVEQIKRTTLQGLLMAEKIAGKFVIGNQPSDDSSAPSHSTTPQEFDSHNTVEKTPYLCKQYHAADNSDLAVATNGTVKTVELEDCSIITQEVVKESVAEDAKGAAGDTKETKRGTERDLECHISNEEEKQGEAHNADSTLAVKPSQRHPNNIMSKVKQSLVKVKKVIIGKSPSSKAWTTPVEAAEINVK